MKNSGGPTDMERRSAKRICSLNFNRLFTAGDVLRRNQSLNSVKVACPGGSLNERRGEEEEADVGN